MLNLDTIPFLAENKTSMKEASLDFETKTYMTDSELEVINFDLVKRSYTNNLQLSENVVTSVDCIMCWRDHIIFIEFKNGKVNNRNVKDKARDSLMIFLDLINKNLSFSRKNIELMIVYNIEKNPLPNQVKKGKMQESPSRIDIGGYFMSKAGGELIRFDLEQYKKIYFKNVRTYSKETFESFLCTIQSNFNN